MNLGVAALRKESKLLSIMGTHATVEETEALQQGGLVTVIGAAVHWACQVQINITLSSKKAEFMATSRESQEEAVSLRGHLSTLEVEQHQPSVIIYEDNEGATCLGRTVQ